MADSPKLYPYQLEGAEWLSKRRFALLADEMGLGKSAQAVTACDYADAFRVLVLCPAAARINWKREFDQFSFNCRNFIVAHSKKDFSKVRATDSVITSYDLAGELLLSSEPPEFDALVLDECHFLKNHEAKRTHVVFSSKRGLVRRSRFVWCLSGTPMPNNPSELWVLLTSFGATSLSFQDFVTLYCTTYEGPRGRVISGTNKKRLPHLKAIIEPHILRRQKTDVLKQLPPITYCHMSVERSPVDLVQHRGFLKYVFPVDRTKELKAIIDKELSQMVQLSFDESILSPNSTKALEFLESMSESVSTLRRYCGLQKVDAIAEMVQRELENREYEKIVIFAIHRDVIIALSRLLAKYFPLYLYGATNAAKRQENIDKFQNNKKYRVFIGQVRAAGTAITLTAAHQVLFAEQSWSPTDNAQAAQRCHRIGQGMPVTVRFVGLADSIDEKISMALKEKAQAIGQLFDNEPIKPTTIDAGLQPLS